MNTLEDCRFAVPEAQPPAPLHGTRSLLHKTGWSTVATASIVIARFLVTIAAARHLGPQGAGRLAYLFWVQEMVATITSLGLQSCVTRFVADLTGRGRAGDCRGLARWLYSRYLALALLGGVGIAAVAVQPWRPVADSTIWICLAACLVSQSMANFYVAYLAGRQQFDRVARVNLISSGALILCAGLGMTLWGLPGILLGYAAGSALPALLSCGLLRRGGMTAALDAGLKSSCLKYAWFAWCAAMMSAFVWSRIEVVFLERYWGNREVAMFSVGLTFATLATQGPVLLGSALLPHFAESVGAGKAGAARVYASAIRLLAALLFPLCLGTASLIPTLLPAVYGAAFRAAVPSAMVLTAFSALALMNVGSALVYASGKAWFVAASGLAGAILSLAGCAAVIPLWGAWGASLSRSAVQTAMAVLGTWYIHRYLDGPAPLRALAKILAASFAAALSSYTILSYLSNVPALALAIPVAVLVYLAMLRMTRALDPDDVRSLRSALERMPAVVSSPMSALLECLAL